MECSSKQSLRPSKSEMLTIIEPEAQADLSHVIFVPDTDKEVPRWFSKQEEYIFLSRLTFTAFLCLDYVLFLVECLLLL